MKWSSGVALVLGLGLVAGVASPAAAYTINTTEVGKRIRWSTDSVTLQLDPALETFLPPGDAYAAVEMGLSAWRGLPRVPDLVLRPGAPNAKPGNHGRQPTNGVYLLEDWPYEPEKLAITVITYEMETGRLLDADVLVNGETKFALLDENAHDKTQDYDLAAVLTHETGHVLGLGESDADEGATMWPYAAPGETQKRTLAQDDEDGVIASYLSHPPRAASGCGTLSVAGRGNARGGLVLGLMSMFALLVFSLRGPGARKQRLRAIAGVTPLCIALIIVGFGEPVRTEDPQARLRERVRALGELDSLQARELVRSAARAADPQTRLDAIETLARAGTRDDRAVAERLSSDEDESVAQRAHQTLGMLLARAPRASLTVDSVEGRARLSRLVGHGAALVTGRAHRVTTLAQDGLLFTEYQVQPADGPARTLRVAGGTIGTIGQRVLDGELPPADDQNVVVVAQPDGRTRWAYAQDGKLFGGDLGDGPALQL